MNNESVAIHGVPNRRQAFAWALYDWANSAFTLSVITVFFPIFLGSYWLQDESVNSTLVLGLANGLASLVIVFLAPILGAVADAAGARKRYLASFAFSGALMSFGLALVGQGNWPLAVVLFVTGTIGFSGANVFYDALLISVARDEEREWVSAFGFALGYLGGSVLFVLNTVMVLKPDWFGFESQASAIRSAFVSVGIWWAVFTLPLLFRVEEPAATRRQGKGALMAGLRQLKHTLREVRALRQAVIFLVGYWLYIDGVNTIVRMAVDFGQQLGFSNQDLILAILLTNLIGFPATLFFGWLTTRIGARAGILLGLAGYVLITLSAWFVREAWHFYLLAGAVGLVQGGVQAASRAFYSRLIPCDRAAEFYGFYNMLGKFAAVLGPVMVGVTAALTGDPRLSILTVLILFVAGAALLMKVDEQEGIAHARSLERQQSRN